MPKNLLRNGGSSSRLTELPALGMDTVSVVADLRRYFNLTLGRPKSASADDLYRALALTVRDRLVERWKSTSSAYESCACKRSYYLSMEFLLGRTLASTLQSLDLAEAVARAMQYLGLELRAILESEPEVMLGESGSGKFAACLLEGCATLQLPVMGYGLRYEYNSFRQTLNQGRQIEQPQQWLRNGNPWELERPEQARRVHFYGHSEFYNNPRGELQVRWVDTYDVLALPYDTLIPGYRNGTVNTLRLWKAAATDTFDATDGNHYLPAVAAKQHNAERISLTHYSSDAGKEYLAWRLRQQYFLVSASLQDVVAHWVEQHGEDFNQFAEKNCFHLNDTQLACTVAEMMRLLMDEHGLGWEPAWAITTRTLAYTHAATRFNDLEKWPVILFRELLPRLLDIIYEINVRFLAEVAHRWPGDNERLRRMSIIEEGEDSQIRMAYLAIVGSFSINGVSASHSRLLQRSLFRDFYKLWPHKFSNKTNGVSLRRWLSGCNPALSQLISEALGAEWLTDAQRLQALVAWTENPEFATRWRAVKQANKAHLAQQVRFIGVNLPSHALFDIQIENIHFNRRQLLNILHVVHLYNRILRGDSEPWTPRCVLFGGKAAPGDTAAKDIIKLIHNVAAVVNSDPAVGERLKVVFLPNVGVAMMEMVCAAADLSEQLGLAGGESSGISPLKLMLNGAVTLGTLDGIDWEIREAVGEEAFFAFGLSAKEAEQTRKAYDPALIAQQDEAIGQVLHLLQSGHFNRFEPGIFDALLRTLTSPDDPWLVLADLRSFIDAQQRVAQAYRDTACWTRLSLLNTAASGQFSVERSAEGYNAQIWKLDRIAAQPVD